MLCHCPTFLNIMSTALMWSPMGEVSAWSESLVPKHKAMNWWCHCGICCLDPHDVALYNVLMVHTQADIDMCCYCSTETEWSVMQWNQATIRMWKFKGFYEEAFSVSWMECRTMTKTWVQDLGASWIDNPLSLSIPIWNGCVFFTEWGNLATMKRVVDIRWKPNTHAPAALVKKAFSFCRCDQ